MLSYCDEITFDTNYKARIKTLLVEFRNLGLKMKLILHIRKYFQNSVDSDETSDIDHYRQGQNCWCSLL